MFKTVKRGTGKTKGCLAIRDMYKYYLSITDKEDIIPYQLFAKITKACNKELINQVVNHSQSIELPYRLGQLQVTKLERVFKLDGRNKYSIDFGKSKKLGIKIFYDSPYIYKWKWKKHHAIVINKTGYKFRANREANRMITKALKNKVDYFK